MVFLIVLWLLCRSIGDADLKPALTAQPEVSQHQLTPEDEFVVVASDGLWDKLSNEEAVGLVHDTVKQPTMAAQRYLLNVATLPAAHQALPLHNPIKILYMPVPSPRIMPETSLARGLTMISSQGRKASSKSVELITCLAPRLCLPIFGLHEDLRTSDSPV